MGLLIPVDILASITLVIIILIIIMWFLYSKNKELKLKLVSERKKFSFYKKQVDILKSPGQETIDVFEKLNEIARSFFKDYFSLDYNLTYLELQENFKNQGKPDYAEFCKLMSDINYSGQKTNKEQIDKLVGLFYNILNKY
jgi:hypothetical protein